MTSLPLLSAALLVMIGCALLLHARGSGRGSNSKGSSRGGRRSSGPRINARVGAASGSRFAPHARFAPSPGGHFAAAQSITAAQPFVAARPFVAAPHFAAAQSIAAAQPFAAGPRLAPDAGDLFVAQPDLHVVSQADPHLVSQPDLRVVAAAPSWSVGPVASVSVLAALTEGDKARPHFAPSNSGDAFPTRGRALALLGGQLLAALGVATLPLASTPIGHHVSHLAHASVASVALLCVLVGLALTVVPTARVQHDIMGGGWYGGFAPRVSYISPEVVRYVISPSGISAAARRLNIAPGRVILVEYALVAAAALAVLDRYVAR
jgi:hypothetical protein